MITEKQLELIERIVAGEEHVTYILKDLDIPTSTYYHWLKNNEPFQKAYDDAIELNVQQARKNIRINVEEYIKRLDSLSLKGKNEQARVNAIAKILTMGELDPTQEQDINVNHSTEDTKNKMLEILRQDNDND